MAQTSLAQHFQKHQQQILEEWLKQQLGSRELARGSAEGKRVARTITRVSQKLHRRGSSGNGGS